MFYCLVLNALTIDNYFADFFLIVTSTAIRTILQRLAIKKERRGFRIVYKLVQEEFAFLFYSNKIAYASTIKYSYQFVHLNFFINTLTYKTCLHFLRTTMAFHAG